MAVRRLSLKRFTSFEDAEFTFSPGLNVLLGKNATGKSHVMKIIYAILRTFHKLPEGFRSSSQTRGGEGRIIIKDRLIRKLSRVFLPDEGHVGRLVRRSRGRKSAQISLEASDSWKASFKLTTLGNISEDGPLRFTFGPTRPALFVPSCEVLSIYEGFAAAYENRELAFDETYYDLAKALSATALRGPRAEQIRDLIRPIERALGGRVQLRGHKFFVKAATKSVGQLEAPLLAEGHRKIGALAHLIANGSLMKQSVLFWDEPEANLNPTLITTVLGLLVSLARQGIQVFLATHDYLVSQELSMLADYGKLDDIGIRFFTLSRARGNLPVTVMEADSLSEIGENAILDEFAAHYDREQENFFQRNDRG